jgi:hypothetical protein
VLCGGGLNEIRGFGFDGAVGDLLENDGVDSLGIAPGRRRRSLCELSFETREDAFVDEHHVLEVFGDGPAVRSGLESPLSFRETFSDVDDLAAGFEEILARLVEFQGMRELAFCSPSSGCRLTGVEIDRRGDF